MLAKQVDWKVGYTYMAAILEEVNDHILWRMWTCVVFGRHQNI